MALPNYISWTGHGSSCGEPPGVFTGATMHLFGLKADRNTMQALVDKFLNPVAGLGRNYQVAVDRALLTFVDIEKGTTATEVVGWLPGQECALWIPIVETEVLPPHLRLVMWSPYIFISYGIGMATGREVWGWSKAMGDFKFPAPGDAAPKFQLDTVIFRKFDVTKQGGSEPLLKVTGDAALNTNSTWAESVGCCHRTFSGAHWCPGAAHSVGGQRCVRVSGHCAEADPRFPIAPPGVLSGARQLAGAREAVRRRRPAWCEVHTRGGHL